MKISIKLVYQYMAIFFNFKPLQLIFIQYKSRIATAIRGSTLFKSCRLMSHFFFNIFKMWYLMC